jgi:hypothetical protein
VLRIGPQAIDIGQPVNRGCPLNYGLVSWWLAMPHRWNGNTFFDIAGTNHGTLTNGPTWGGALGRPGGTGSLSGNGSVNGVPTALSIPNTAYTMMGWIRMNGTGDYPVLMSSHGANWTAIRFFGGSTRLNLLHCDAVDLNVDVADALTTGVWYHVAQTWNGATAKLYINGVEKLSGNSAAVPTGTIDIGYDSSSGIRKLNANYDSLSVHNRGLSASEVLWSLDDSRRGYPLTLNRVSPLTVFDVGGGAATTVRPRSLLTLGCGA